MAPLFRSRLPMTLSPPRRPLSLLLITSLVLATMLGVMYLAGHYMTRTSLHKESVQLNEQLQLYAGQFTTLIERFRSLPAVLALDPDIRQALSEPLTPALQQRLNLKLERINGAAHSSTLELMRADGLAIAASNWRLPTSYVNHNYGFRPYFQQTKETGSGRFYGVGVISGIPGYFLSSAVMDDQGRFLGAIVVKLEFPELEESWAQSQDILLVSDARGIVFIANHPHWRYRTLKPLSSWDEQELQATRQYDKVRLQPLQLLAQQTLGPSSQRVQLRLPDGQQGDYLWQSQPLLHDGWTLHLLRDPNPGLTGVTAARLAAAGAWLSLVFLLLWLQQRRRLHLLRQRSQAELEQLVEQRTAALRTAQNGLVQAAKLAALGQMSAALAHELNQPLTAQRMELASLRLLLDHQRLDEARQTLSRLDLLLQRMAALTSHLKSYARHSPDGLRERLNLTQVVEQTLLLMSAQLRQRQIQVATDLPLAAWVEGDAIRLEQVLVNLLSNALDATQQHPMPQLSLRIHQPDDQPASWCLSVMDNGGGMAEGDLARVFDPFFTTKPSGAGLGLGLAISHAIVHQLGGELLASNSGDGACFSLRLPACEPLAAERSLLP